MQLNSTFRSLLWPKQNGLTAKIQVTNTGAAANDWGIKISLDYPIRQRADNTYELIGGEVESVRINDNGKYVYHIKPAEYNQELKTEQSVFLAFNGNYERGDRITPNWVVLDYEESAIPEPELEQPATTAFEYSYSTWSYNSGSTVTVKTEEKGGTIEFTSDFKIREKSNDIWNAEIVEQEQIGINQYRYVIELKSYADTFGFNTLNPNPGITADNIIAPSPTEPEPPVVEVEEPPIQPPALPPTGGVTRPEYNKSTGFFTHEGKIYDRNGSEFIARGVNNRHVWFDHNSNRPALNALDNIANFGFNAVRVVWEVDHDRGIVPNRRGNLTNDNLLVEIIETAIANDLAPMVELHDFTGRNDPQELLDEGVSWWVDRADIWNRFEGSLMINIANEFGDYRLARGSARLTFPQVYSDAIAQIRDAGINNTIVIDSFDYGKDYSLITEYGQEIIDSDPQRNVVFSVHFYCGHGENPNAIAEAFDSITGQGIPLVIGEYGPTHQPCGDVRDDLIMQEAEAHGVGTYAWAWEDKEWALATHWEADSLNELTQFGRDVVAHANSGT